MNAKKIMDLEISSFHKFSVHTKNHCGHSNECQEEPVGWIAYENTRYKQCKQHYHHYTVTDKLPGCLFSEVEGIENRVEHQIEMPKVQNQYKRNTPISIESACVSKITEQLMTPWDNGWNDE